MNSLALLPDGLRFVSGSDDETTRIAEIGLDAALRKREALVAKAAKLQSEIAQPQAEEKAA